MRATPQVVLGGCTYLTLAGQSRNQQLGDDTPGDGLGLIDQIQCATHLANLNQDECCWTIAWARAKFRLACSQARGP
jgi:hypothetical protein